MNKDFLLSQSEKAPEGQIHFIASSDFSNIDFFQNITDASSRYDFSNLKVYINGELTNQAANSISASANDDIIIKATRGVYPWFGHSTTGGGFNIDYIKSIEEPLPLMYTYNSNPIERFDYCFYECSNLTSIPEGLFDNNPQITNFDRCFYYCSSLTNIPTGLFNNNVNATYFDGCFHGCSSLTNIPTGLFDKNTRVTRFSECFRNCSNLTSIPTGLFDKNTQVTNFSNCFQYCSSLTSIPADLFDKNTQVVTFYYCFYSCRNLTVNVQIGSTESSVDVDYFARNTKAKGTVYCKAGSAAYTSFARSSTANVNVLTY